MEKTTQNEPEKKSFISELFCLAKTNIRDYMIAMRNSQKVTFAEVFEIYISAVAARGVKEIMYNKLRKLKTA